MREIASRRIWGQKRRQPPNRGPGGGEVPGRPEGKEAEAEGRRPRRSWGAEAEAKLSSFKVAFFGLFKDFPCKLHFRGLCGHLFVVISSVRFGGLQSFALVPDFRGLGLQENWGIWCPRPGLRDADATRNLGA